MKTLCITFLLLGFAQFSYCQTDLAYTETSVMNLENIPIRKDISAASKSAIEVSSFMEKAKKLEWQALNYDIKSASVYSPNLKTTYSVSFTQNNNRIDAVYDAEGRLLQSEGTFEDVCIPHAIGYQLAKTYPGWEFHKSWRTTNYTLNGNDEIIYKVQLKKGNKIKVIKVNPLEYGL